MSMFKKWMYQGQHAISVGILEWLEWVWGSILCTYSVELYSWFHELCVGGIQSWSGFRSRGILKGHEHYI